MCFRSPCSAETAIRGMSAYNIMLHSIHLFQCYIKTLQPLNAAAINACETFSSAMLQHLYAGEIDFENIWFSDETHFSLDGFVNKLNWRIWGNDDNHVPGLSSLRSQKIIDLSAMSSKGHIGLSFRLKTVTTELYLHIQREFVAVQNALVDPENSTWSIQDAIRPYQKADILNFIYEHFFEHAIDLNYSKYSGRAMNFHPYPPSLSHCDFFPCGGYLKDQVYY